jgi:Lon protease-like protein
MVLPNVILFPQAFLPLYIFEPRYRLMLKDALETHRLFCVAMQRPGWKREIPRAVAGLGLIRAAREHADGSTHLILQGVARVRLGPSVRNLPYRTHAISVQPSQTSDTVQAGALAARLLELVADRLRRGAPVAPGLEAFVEAIPGGAVSDHPGAEFLAQVTQPEQIADMVSWALLSSPTQRQQLLETLDVETRLRRLIAFLMKDRPDDGAA